MIGVNVGRLFNPSLVHVGSSIAANTLLTGLQAYWKFDETSGSTAADASGNGHTATWAGTLGSQWAAAKINNGASLNGTDNFLTFTPPANIGNAFTLAGWCFVHGAVSGNQYMIALGANDVNEITIFNSHIRVVTNPSTGFIMDSVFTVTVDTWFHVAFAWDGTTMSLYVNGSLDSSHASTSNAADATSYIGEYAAGPGHFYNGKIDELGIWNIALSQANITALYNSGAGLSFASFH